MPKSLQSQPQSFKRQKTNYKTKNINQGSKTRIQKSYEFTLPGIAEGRAECRPWLSADRASDFLRRAQGVASCCHKVGGEHHEGERCSQG